MLTHESDALTPVSDPNKYESHFGGIVEVIETRGEGPMIYHANGTDNAQTEATIREITTYTGRGAFALRLSGERKPDRTYLVERDPQKASLIVPMQQAREAASLLGVIAKRYDMSTQGIDAIFQSESAGHGIIAAYTRPGDFNSIVLAFPASVSGPQRGFVSRRVLHDGLLRLRHRIHADNDFRDRSGTKGRLHRLHQQTKEPGFWADAAALRYSALAPMLHALRERDDPPGVTLIAGHGDKIITPKALLKSLVASTDVEQIIVMPGYHAISGRRDVLVTILDQIPFMTTLRAFRRQAQAEGRNIPIPPLRDRLHLPPDMPPRYQRYLYQLADEVDHRTYDDPLSKSDNLRHK